MGRISKSVSIYQSFFITNFNHLTMFLAFQLSCQPHKKTRSMQHYSKAVSTTQSKTTVDSVMTVINWSLFSRLSLFLWSFSFWGGGIVLWLCFMSCLESLLILIFVFCFFFCSENCVETDQPTNQLKYQVQVGSWPNVVNTKGQKHILVSYLTLLVIITHQCTAICVVNRDICVLSCTQISV